MELPAPAEKLVRRVVFGLACRYQRKRPSRRGYFWGDVAEAFCCGSTYATRIARACGHDPDTGIATQSASVPLADAPKEPA